MKVHWRKTEAFVNFYVWGILVRGIQATNAPLKETPGFQFISSEKEPERLSWFISYPPMIAFHTCSWPRLRFLTWIKEKPPRWHGAWKNLWLPTAHVQVQVRVRWTKDYTSSKTVWDFYQICYSWQQSERLKNHSIKISTVAFHFSWDVNDDHVKHCCLQV